VRVKLKSRVAAVGLVLILSLVALGQTTKPQGPARWEKDISAFEAKDQEKMPEPGGIVFVGSSSIKAWKLADSFPGVNAINRGFGGSQVADSAHFAERIVIKYRPSIVVLYAGDNDIGGGKSPEAVAKSDLEFVHKVHAALPETRIVRISVKPSIKLWSKYAKIQDLNERLKKLAEEEKNLVFVDITSKMLSADQQPRPELFRPDGLHMTPEGYELWTRLVKPHLEK
jgi:lysophospholipase L1-like esterase